MSQSVTINIQDAIKNIEGYIHERRESKRPVTLKAIAIRLNLLAPLYQAKVLLHLSKDTSLPEFLRIDMKNCASMIVENMEANRTSSASAVVQQMEKNNGTQQQQQQQQPTSTPTPTPTPTPAPVPTTPQQPLSVPPADIPPPSTPIASSTPAPMSEQPAPLPPQTVAPEDVSAQRSRVVMSRRGPPASWSNVPTAAAAAV